MKKSIIKKTASLILVFAMILSVMVVASTGASAAIVESMGCISVGTSTDSYHTAPDEKGSFITIQWKALSKATDYNIRVIDFKNENSPTYSVQKVHTGFKKAGTNIKSRVYGVNPKTTNRYLISVTPLKGTTIIGDTAYVSPTSQKSNKVYSPYMKRKPSGHNMGWYWENGWTYYHPQLIWRYDSLWKYPEDYLFLGLKFKMELYSSTMKPSETSKLYNFSNEVYNYNEVTRKYDYYNKFAWRDDQAFQICITDKSDNNKKSYRSVKGAYKHEDYNNRIDYVIDKKTGELKKGNIPFTSTYFKCDLYRNLKNNHKYKIEVKPYMNDDKGCQVTGPTILSVDYNYKAEKY